MTWEGSVREKNENFRWYNIYTVIKQNLRRIVEWLKNCFIYNSYIINNLRNQYRKC